VRELGIEELVYRHHRVGEEPLLAIPVIVPVPPALVEEIRVI